MYMMSMVRMDRLETFCIFFLLRLEKQHTQGYISLIREGSTTHSVPAVSVLEQYRHVEIHLHVQI